MHFLYKKSVDVKPNDRARRWTPNTAILIVVARNQLLAISSVKAIRQRTGETSDSSHFNATVVIDH